METKPGTEQNPATTPLAPIEADPSRDLAGSILPVPTDAEAQEENGIVSSGGVVTGSGGIGQAAGWLNSEGADESAMQEETSLKSGGLIGTRGGIGQMADLTQEEPAAEVV